MEISIQLFLHITRANKRCCLYLFINCEQFQKYICVVCANITTHGLLCVFFLQCGIYNGLEQPPAAVQNWNQTRLLLRMLLLTQVIVSAVLGEQQMMYRQNLFFVIHVSWLQVLIIPPSHVLLFFKYTKKIIILPALVKPNLHSTNGIQKAHLVFIKKTSLLLYVSSCSPWPFKGIRLLVVWQCQANFRLTLLQEFD